MTLPHTAVEERRTIPAWRDFLSFVDELPDKAFENSNNISPSVVLLGIDFPWNIAEEGAHFTRSKPKSRTRSIRTMLTLEDLKKARTCPPPPSERRNKFTEEKRREIEAEKRRQTAGGLDKMEHFVSRSRTKGEARI